MDFDDVCILTGVAMVICAIAWFSIAIAVFTTGFGLISYGGLIAIAARRENR